MGLYNLGAKLNQNIFVPFLNATVFRLINWYYSGSNLKTQSSLDSLVKDVLLAEDFNPSHLKGFSAAKELRRLDKALEVIDDNGNGDWEDADTPLSGHDGWRNSTVKIPLPAEGHKYTSEDDAPTLEVPNVLHQSLVATIKAVFQDEDSASFHYTPFRQFWKATPASPPERLRIK
ncbi:hypothetical protein CPC08DRAFT_643501 [Agrocybe pediades]|nr:hypothetical protein CPC08DRAFT_643501 [Agrocybe pediades]